MVRWAVAGVGFAIQAALGDVGRRFGRPLALAGLGQREDGLVHFLPLVGADHDGGRAAVARHRVALVLGTLGGPSCV